MSKVAVIGLGSMGLGVAQSLHRAGFPLAGCDISSTARAHLADMGIAVSASPAEAAVGASALIVMVVDAGQTDAVLFGPSGAATAMAPGSVIISSATMSPDDARRLAARASETGLLYLDAPVSGGASRAAVGELSIMASGSTAAFAAAQPVLDAIASSIHAPGDEPGTGAAYKMINQLLAGVHIAAACEAITFASKLGLDLDSVYEVIRVSAGNSWMFENRVPHILAGDYKPLSAVDIFTKDLGIVTAIGQRERFPTPIATTALQMFLMTSAAGMGRDDDSSVARMIAQITGLDLPSPPRSERQ